ncbi:hypothetical protein CMO96_03005 [Candidatus Woesebacteria bacterium]|nr:hypothetical protein [Candidatus Woesebacteria bacterium]
MKLVSEEIPTLVKKLRGKKVKVVIATDNMDSFTRWTAPALNLKPIFDEILSSHELKVTKSAFGKNGESLFFKDYFRKNNIKPQETVLIDDGEDKENRLGRLGIDYRRIKALGLVAALKRLTRNPACRKAC